MENQELTVGFFRERVTSEVSRLQGLCSKWQEATVDQASDGVDPDDVRCAVGKASILISGRIKQFSSLIDDCERAEKSGGASDRPVTKVTDLQGFWEMVGLQIEDVDKLFCALDPANKEEPAVQTKNQSAKRVLNKGAKVAAVKIEARKVKRPASSALKAHITAMRKELKSSDPLDDGAVAMAEAVSSVTPLKPNINVQNCENDGGDNRVFDGVFFKVSSPSYAHGSPRVARGPVKLDLQSPSGFNRHQVKKTPGSATAATGPLAIMRATQISRLSLSPNCKATLDYKGC